MHAFNEQMGNKRDDSDTSCFQQISNAIGDCSARAQKKHKASDIQPESQHFPVASISVNPLGGSTTFTPSTTLSCAFPAAEKENLVYRNQFSGYIFMCNGKTKADCYRYRVFGLPAARRSVVEKIRPCTTLFLFDFDLKLLYGIYTAASNGGLGIEPTAFGGKFLAQVKFEISKDCLPLPEHLFKHAIRDNYSGGSKFRQELSKEQVSNLILLFHPISIPPALFAKAKHSVELPTSYNQYLAEHKVTQESGGRRTSQFEFAAANDLQSSKPLDYKMPSYGGMHLPPSSAVRFYEAHPVIPLEHSRAEAGSLPLPYTTATVSCMSVLLNSENGINMLRNCTSALHCDNGLAFAAESLSASSVQVPPRAHTSSYGYAHSFKPTGSVAFWNSNEHGYNPSQGAFAAESLSAKYVQVPPRTHRSSYGYAHSFEPPGSVVYCNSNEHGYNQSQGAFAAESLSVRFVQVPPLAHTSSDGYAPSFGPPGSVTNCNSNEHGYNHSQGAFAAESLSARFVQVPPQAHTSSDGYAPSFGAPGSVAYWNSYEHGYNQRQGASITDGTSQAHCQVPFNAIAYSHYSDGAVISGIAGASTESQD